jgi:hypothetical protein
MGGVGPLRMMGTDPGQFAQRSQIGIYDAGILCEPCERSLAPFDDYGADLLINRRDSAFQRYAVADRTLFVAAQFDYAKLRLFIISVLWRASVSAHKFFYRISLGPFEQTAKEMILRGDTGEADLFSAVLSRWTVPAGAALPPKLMANPYQYRDDEGIHRARLYLGSFVADISVESRPLPSPLSNVAISPRLPLNALGRDLLTSRDLTVFRETLLTSPQRKRR